jgi:hypothetical protein
LAMLNVFRLNVANNPFSQSGSMLNTIMSSVITPIVVMLGVVALKLLALNWKISCLCLQKYWNCNLTFFAIKSISIDLMWVQRKLTVNNNLSILFLISFFFLLCCRDFSIGRLFLNSQHKTHSTIWRSIFSINTACVTSRINL